MKMPKQYIARATIPAELLPILVRIGSRISLARRRRGWRLIDLAKKIGVSPPTMVRIEKGEPTVAFGAVATVLWALGLTHDLAKLADPSRDQIGLSHDLGRVKARVRPRKLDNDF